MIEARRAVTDDANFAERLELLFGRASDTVAYVYARLPEMKADGAYQLSGRLSGPACLYAQTLPARFRLVDRGPGPSLLAVATVPEPCFWTPRMPHLYQADVELRRGSEVLARTSRSFGIRTLGCAGRSLMFDAKRWVLRAASCDEVPTTTMAECREASTAMVVQNPADELCREASHVGVLLVAQLDAPDLREIRRLSRWPAVGMVVLSNTDQATGSALAELGHNLLFAERFGLGNPVEPAPWAQVALVDVGAVDELAALTGNSDFPLIAVRQGEAFASVAAARAACDRLQRDLAGRDDLVGADWAGYVV
jgi:hypothetical protein